MALLALPGVGCTRRIESFIHSDPNRDGKVFPIDKVHFVAIPDDPSLSLFGKPPTHRTLEC